MTKFLRNGFVCAILFATAVPALATPSVSLSPATGHPQQTFKVSGSGFAANKAVDIYWDTTDEVLVIADSVGAMSSRQLTVPADALPGTHWVTAIERDNGNGAQASFYVRTLWAQFGFGAHGTRNNPYENVISAANVDRLGEAWHYKTGGAVNSSPAVYGGIVYVGSDDGYLYAINVATGALKWKSPTAGKIYYSSPAVSGTTVYVGSYSPNLWAINTANGAVRWTYGDGSVVYSPTVVGNTVYFGTNSGNIYALDATTGAKRWNSPTGGLVSATPAVANGIVYAGSHDGLVYAIDAVTGAQKWTYDAVNYISGSAAVGYGRVFVAASDSYVYALDPDTGLVLSQTSAPYSVIVSPALGYGMAYTATFGPQGIVDAWKPRLASKWDTSFGGDSFVSSPAIAGGVIYIGGLGTHSDGSLYALDAHTGAELWSSGTSGQIQSSPAVADGRVFVGSGDGKLYAYALDAGTNAVYHRESQPPRMEQLHPNLRLKTAR